MALPISQEDFSCQLPMSTFDQDDVTAAIAIQVADTGVGRGLGNAFQGNDFKDWHGCEAEQDNGKSCGYGEHTETLH
jgi:hypothetical protein